MENKIGKTLNIIGILTIVIGIIGSLIINVSLYDDTPIIFFVGGIISFVSGMVFIGFAEIISLLQKNVDKQEELAKILKEKDFSSENNKPKTILQDIESDLPKI